MRTLLLYALGLEGVALVVLAWLSWVLVTARCEAERRARRAERALVVERRRWGIHREHDRLRDLARDAHARRIAEAEELARWGRDDDGQETVDA